MTRNLDHDMALCRAATPPPWRWDAFRNFGGREEVRNIDTGITAADKIFITAAREGWPWAIARIKQLQAQLDKFLHAGALQAAQYLLGDPVIDALPEEVRTHILTIMELACSETRMAAARLVETGASDFPDSLELAITYGANQVMAAMIRMLPLLESLDAQEELHRRLACEHPCVDGE